MQACRSAYSAERGYALPSGRDPARGLSPGIRYLFGLSGKLRERIEAVTRCSYSPQRHRNIRKDCLRTESCVRPTHSPVTRFASSRDPVSHTERRQHRRHTV